MPEIRGTLSREPDRPTDPPCVWCEQPTGTRAETPGRPDLGEVPLHVICAAEIVMAYRRWSNGSPLPSGIPDRLAKYQARLLAIDTARKLEKDDEGRYVYQLPEVRRAARG